MSRQPALEREREQHGATDGKHRSGQAGQEFPLVQRRGAGGIAFGDQEIRSRDRGEDQGLRSRREARCRRFARCDSGGRPCRLLWPAGLLRSRCVLV